MKATRWSKFKDIVKNRTLRQYTRMLVEPNNKKLKYFHLLVAVMLVYDFLLSGFIMANYEFHENPDDKDNPNVSSFAHHRSSYFFICTV